MRRLVPSALIVATYAAVAFLLGAVFLGGLAAATVGVILDLLLLASVRPKGLRSSWAYLRSLS
jgi:hypothetical protein